MFYYLNPIFPQTSTSECFNLKMAAGNAATGLSNLSLIRGQGRKWTHRNCKTFQARFVTTSQEWPGCNVDSRLWKATMPLSSRRAFVSPDGRRPTAMASALSRCTSVRLRALATVVLLLMSVTSVKSSQGDKEPVYRDCVKQCVRTNCTGARLRGFESTQPQYMALTGESMLVVGE